jgi:heme/copper-type cytochrome/quinol oxidase subunit 2
VTVRDAFTWFLDLKLDRIATAMLIVVVVLVVAYIVVAGLMWYFLWKFDKRPL